MDSSELADGNGRPKFSNAQPNISDAITGFFLRQTFIGHQLCALLAQHWLLDKACTQPARDAVRHWFDIRRQDGEELDDQDVVQRIRQYDKVMGLKAACVDFIRGGRIFGIRVVIFKVNSPDPLYYEKPFNPDGVTPGSYKGMAAVDPYWMTPLLDAAATADPGSLHFYEPTWWQINGVKYHRSHLAIYRHSDPADILKPSYLYGGVPLIQQIVERVYAAERTANEAPELAMTKRTTILKTDAAMATANGQSFTERLMQWVRYRDNYAVKVVGQDDEMTQMDTTLTDLDAVIMTNYQLVAAAARVPATKLMGTSPKGFNASGEYEESSYHEELETIQQDINILVDRHHLLVKRSYLSAEQQTFDFHAVWAPTDSPTKKEAADIRLANAQSDMQLIQTGAIDEYDVRDRLRNDPNSGYSGIAPAERVTRPIGNDAQGQAA